MNNLSNQSSAMVNGIAICGIGKTQTPKKSNYNDYKFTITKLHNVYDATCIIYLTDYRLGFHDPHYESIQQSNPHQRETHREKTTRTKLK